MSYGNKSRSSSGKDNTLYIRRNERKETEKHPDYWGSGLINGDEYRVAGWINEGDKGPYLALKVEPDDGSNKKSSSSRRSDF